MSPTLKHIGSAAELRDWFAAEALAGILRATSVSGTPTAIAQLSYEIADAMIAARGDVSGALQDDLREFMKVLGLPDGPQPLSPHEVFQVCLEVLKMRINYREPSKQS